MHLDQSSTERLAEAGLVPTVGSVGESCDNALAETINGLVQQPPSLLDRQHPALDHGQVLWIA